MGSRKYILETVKAKIKDPVIQNTDHKFLIFNFVNNRLFSTNNNVKKYKNKVIYDYQETEEINKEFFDQTLINSVETWHKYWPIQDKWEFYKRNLIENKEKFYQEKRNHY